MDYYAKFTTQNEVKIIIICYNFDTISSVGNFIVLLKYFTKKDIGKMQTLLVKSHIGYYTAHHFYKVCLDEKSLGNDTFPHFINSDKIISSR
jgi:hypothetical protein